MKIREVGDQLLQTDMTKPIAPFHNFANTSKNIAFFSLYRNHLLVFITEAKCVYCVVQAKSVNKLFLSAFAKL
jgi:hypothetical protein